MEEDRNSAVYSCRKCSNPVAFSVDLLSKNYVAKSGQAYMFSHAMNVIVGPRENRQLITGQYTIAKIFCSKCSEEMGWTYLWAFDPKGSYKVGKYIMEKAKIFKKY